MLGNARSRIADFDGQRSALLFGAEQQLALAAQGLHRIGQDVGESLTQLVGKRIDHGGGHVALLNIHAERVIRGLHNCPGLVQFRIDIDRHALVLGFARGDAGEVSNDRGHSLAVNDDVAGIGLDTK